MNDTEQTDIQSQNFPNAEVDIVPAFEKLEQLIIGELDYDWSQIFSISSGLPNLQLLHCHSNRYNLKVWHKRTLI